MLKESKNFVQLKIIFNLKLSSQIYKKKYMQNGKEGKGKEKKNPFTRER